MPVLATTGPSRRPVLFASGFIGQLSPAVNFTNRDQPNPLAALAAAASPSYATSLHRLAHMYADKYRVWSQVPLRLFEQHRMHACR